MKINVTVDLEDFYSESEESFNDQILEHISYQVKHQIWTEFKNKGLEVFTKKVNQELDEGKDEEIGRIVHKIFTEKKLRNLDGSRGKSEEYVTLYEFIEHKINHDYFSPNKTADSLLNGLINEKYKHFHKSVSDAAQEISNELKDRYDMLFASQIVSNLNKAGMLKDDVGKLLLGPQ
jgi:hypothetical protein